MAAYFISFSSADIDWAEWISWQLEESGHTTVIQEWDFTPGANVSLKTDEAAAKADKVIAILSPDYLATLYAKPDWAAEFAEAVGGTEKKVIPVRIKDCSLEGPLKKISYIDLVGLNEEGAELELLSKISAKSVQH